ncbi:AbrB family transcriptional regulator [Sphingomonas sp. CROZ-RG-20F-R02-07]|uniref:AbrB family transcriptional regulator n=1 Tax=Sphingomonas sp. CROZ-RG-20F-R02-07 TaxID=2914832 RepID=UPI001F562130
MLLLASAALAAVLELAGLPAGLLLGPMVVGIVLGVRGWAVAIPDLAFRAAQALVGCLIAGAIDAGIVRDVAAHGWLFAGTTAATLAVSVAIGWLGARWQVLPGTVAIWGSMPGAATAMVLMARSFGADPRLVAVMTYSRVVCVAAIASLLAAMVSGHHGGAHGGAVPWFPAIDPLRFGETLAVAGVGAALGTWLRIPAGALLGPILLGAGLSVAGLVRFELPGWLLAIAYAVVGWRIGLGFTREIVAAAARALPRILASIAVLILFCGGLALLLAKLAHVDPVTAYLATSPGGMDSVAIIAASTPVDVPFVMALQLLRFVAVLLVGPVLARLLARRHGGDR